LVEPEIPWNTGNIARTCVGTGSILHLVGRCGFSLEDKDLKRAGLDYWPKLALRRHPSWSDFLKTVPPQSVLLLLSTKGKHPYWEASIPDGSYLIFGSETRGLPAELLGRWGKNVYRIPITEDIRSLNLSTAAGIVLYEAIRQKNCPI